MANVVQSHPQGLSEHELLRQLRREVAPFMTPIAASDTLGLFRQHFVLMHALYLWQQRLARQQGLNLYISPLRISLEPGRPEAETAMPVQADAVRGYYLDLTNLEETGADEVEELLNDFWQRLEGSGERDRALAELGLAAPVGPGAIKRRYRQLAMQHHPDRGGDTARLQRLHEAMRQLRKAGAV